MDGTRTDHATMVSPRKAQASRVHPLKALAGAVTPTGWALTVFIVVALILAATLEWVEALACALAGVVALVLAATRVAWKPPHVVSIRVPNERIVAGQTAVGEISVRNERGRPVRAGIIELPIGSGTGEFVVPPLGAHEKWDEMFLISSRHRGLINVGPARAVRSDPLGLLRRVRSWDEPVVLHVHPVTIRVPFDATGFQLDVEGVSTGKLSSSDVSFHALRDYEPGDDRRAVHWQSTARLGKLIVRQYEETHRSHHLIVLDTARSSWDRDSFEDGISVAASLALSGIAASRTVSFAAGKRWVPTTTAVSMLDTLASLSFSGRSDITARVRRAFASCPSASYVSVIAPSSVSDEEAAHLAQVTPRDVTVQVLRINPKQRARRRSLEGGVLFDCPSLQELAHLVGGLR